MDAKNKYGKFVFPAITLFIAMYFFGFFISGDIDFRKWSELGKAICSAFYVLIFSAYVMMHTIKE